MRTGLPQGDPAAAGQVEHLYASVSYPGDAVVYLVNGKPVLIFWGYFDPSTQVLTLASTIVGTPNRRLPSLAWLTRLAALALLAAIVWYWWHRAEMSVLDMAVEREIPAVFSIEKSKPSPPPAAPLLTVPSQLPSPVLKPKIVTPPTVIVYDNYGF